MTQVRTVRSAQLLLFLALCVGAAPALGKEPTGLAAWKDQAYLETHLAKACDAVEKHAGAEFTQRPVLRITTADEMTEILKKEIGPLLERLGSDEAAVEQSCQLTARHLLAKCEPATNTIHILPANVERITAAVKRTDLRTTDILRVLLAHEATHAHDFQRFPALDRARLGRDTQDGVLAAGAIVEGHAQYVTKRIADTWNLSSAFDRMLELILSMPTETPLEKAMGPVLVAEVRFSYVKGHQFLEAVGAAQGREGIHKVLASPPEDVGVIENPERYLQGGAAQETDPAPVLDHFREAIAEGAQVNQVRFRRVQLEAVFSLIPEDERKPILEKYEDGWILIAQGDGKIVSALLARFDSAETAKKYVALTLALLQKKDRMFTQGGAVRIEESRYEFGVGPKRERPGLVVFKKVRTPLKVQEIYVHIASQGRYAIEFSLVDTGVDGEKQDAIVVAALEAIEKLDAE